MIVYTPSQTTKYGDYNTKYIDNNSTKENCQLIRKMNTFLSFSVLKGRVLSIFRQDNLSEMDIKVLIPAPTCFILKKFHFKKVSYIRQI